MSRRTTMLSVLTWALLAAATPAWADFRLDRQLALRPGGSFVLDTDGGSVMLSGGAASGASVSITSRRDDADDRYDFRFEETAGEVRVIVRRKGGWLSRTFDHEWWSSGSLAFTIEVPRDTAVNLRTSGGRVEVSGLSRETRVSSSGGSLHVEDVAANVNARTSGGSIRMRDVDGDVVAETSGGSIDLTQLGGRVRADTSGGSIRIDGARNEVYAETSGGSVDVRNAGDRVEARSSGGPVTVRFSPGNGRGGELSTSGGGVRAEVDPDVALSIDASSSGGRVTSDLPVTVQGNISRNALRGDLNGGGPTLRLRSSGGGVRLSRTSTR